MSSNDKIKVMCRFRPPNKFEKENSKLIDVSIAQNNQVKLIEHHTSKDIPHTFNFDYVFDMQTEQVHVYDEVAKPVVEGVFEGWNGSILAYGQTSSGKTFTMQGVLLQEEQKGIAPRVVDEIFQFIQESPENLEFIVKIQMLEIYMEEVKDLLNPHSKKKIRIRKSPTQGIYAENLAEVCVVDNLEVQTLYNKGISNRAIGRTNMNAVSSRSHMITILSITQKDTIENNIKKGKFYLIDLAGSEKIGKTGVSGQALEEAKLINKSLLWLGNVINALTEGQPFIPYRNSKLTQILEESLGGNSKTTLIVTCSPSIYNIQETISTLKFGIRAKKVVNKVVANVELSKEQLIKNLEKAQERICYLEGYNDFLKQHIKHNLQSQLPIYKHKKSQQTDQNKDVQKRGSIQQSSINPEIVEGFEKRIKELEEKLQISEENCQNLEEKLSIQAKQSAVQNAKFQHLLEDYKGSQIEINDLKDLLMHQEEINKQLQTQLDNFEQQEQEKTQQLNKVAQSISDDNTKKNQEVMYSFIDNLNLVNKEKQLLQNYMKKIINQSELLGNQNQKLKTISKNLLENYQNLVDNELPGLEENHQQIIQDLLDKEREKNFACNDKIMDLVCYYIQQIDMLKGEVQKKENLIKGQKDRFSQYKKQAQNKMHCFKNKIELLGKCVNIAITKYEEFKAKTMEHPPMNVEVQFDQKDDFTSNAFATYNPLMDNMNQGTQIIKMIRGKKKVDEQQEDIDEEDEDQII